MTGGAFATGLGFAAGLLGGEALWLRLEAEEDFAVVAAIIIRIYLDSYDWGG